MINYLMNKDIFCKKFDIYSLNTDVSEISLSRLIEPTFYYRSVKFKQLDFNSFSFSFFGDSQLPMQGEIVFDEKYFIIYGRLKTIHLCAFLLIFFIPFIQDVDIITFGFFGCVLMSLIMVFLFQYFSFCSLGACVQKNLNRENLRNREKKSKDLDPTVF